MSYREYVPTCVETLFGRPPTKFKARAIIPYSGRHRCCTCQKHNSQKKALCEREDFLGNNAHYKCIMNYPDCRKISKRKEDIAPYHEEVTEKRRLKGRSRRGDQYDCCCIQQCDLTEEEYYPEEITRTKHRAIKHKKYCPEAPRSTDSTEHSDCERFCDVCQVWVRSESDEKRDEYSSKRYEDRERTEDPKTTREGPNSRKYHFVVECCKFCGNCRDRPSESDEKEEDNCQALQSFVQTQEICAMGKQIEQCSHSEGFFSIKKLDEPQIRSNDKEKERDSCDGIFERYAAEMAALEHYPETLKDDDLMEQNSQENVLNDNIEQSFNREFRKAHSASEINNIEKQFKNKNEDLEFYKEQLMTELKEKAPEKSEQNTEFRSCNCEYARSNWKVEAKNKLEPDKSDIRVIMKKCDEALGQLELFKRQIATNKKEKCQCDLESTMGVVQDCKHRCAQLEKQVGYLQRCIDCYTRSKAKNKEGNWEVKRQQDRPIQKKKIQERQTPSSTPKRDQAFKKDHEVRPTNVKVSTKPKSTCSPARVRNIRCQHIRCFPQDQITDIPSFKMCPGYVEKLQRRSNNR